jgi:hypothetical protein
MDAAREMAASIAGLPGTLAANIKRQFLTHQPDLFRS